VGVRRLPTVHRPCATLAVLLALLAGCTPESGKDQNAVALGHIHGLGVNPADETLYAASHHGLFRVTGDKEPEQIAGRTQDFMGFTIVGPNHFLASGHPAPDDTSQPPNLGLIDSTDGGQTWTSVSLSGEVDFHAMEAKHSRVYGYDSQSGQLMTSADRHTWDRGARLGIADIAVAPDQPDEIIATTRQGLERSTDGGRTFTSLPGAPTLVLVDWPETGRLIGAGPDGAIYASTDRGVTWTRRGQVGGSPHAITTFGETDVYVATDDAIEYSRDDRSTFEVFEQF
jgi:hypothetical protein